jgi:hypothetical protein
LPVHRYTATSWSIFSISTWRVPFTRAARSRYFRVTDCLQPGATYMRAHKESWFLHHTALPATAVPQFVSSSETGTQR